MSEQIKESFRIVDGGPQFADLGVSEIGRAVHHAAPPMTTAGGDGRYVYVTSWTGSDDANGVVRVTSEDASSRFLEWAEAEGVVAEQVTAEWRIHSEGAMCLENDE